MMMNNRKSFMDSKAMAGARIAGWIIVLALLATITYNVVDLSPPAQQGWMTQPALGPSMSALAEEMGLTTSEYPRVFDVEGIERDWAWLQETYGAVEITRAEAHPETVQIFRIVELRAVLGPSTQIVRVLDEQGLGINGTIVCRHWASAPALPEYDPPASRWFDNAVYGPVNANGDIGFGMGTGDMYDPQAGEHGASAVWIADYSGPSDLVNHLGWLLGTNHQGLIVVYMRVASTPPTPTPEPEPPTPTPDPEHPTMSEQLEQIYQELHRIGNHLGAP